MDPHLKGLIARLEDADGPDRELDNAIWDAFDQPLPADPAGWPPRYTASIDAARSIENDVLCVHASDIGADGLPLVRLVSDTSTSPIIEHVGIARTLELAWCIAALKARASQPPKVG